jgi:fumarate reductase subunit D
MSQEAIECTVRNFQWIYTVVIALSVGEAFKQFVPDRRLRQQKSGVHWDQLPSLLSLLFLVVPFFHGMTRFFHIMYSKEKINELYGAWLLVDCATFTVEAALFFVLARSLPTSLWSQFSVTVMVLLWLDIVWGVFTWKYRTSLISPWVIVNVCTMPALMGVFLFLRSRKRTPRLAVTASILVLGGLVIRTVVDYSTGWAFYFPKQ